jgi:aminopeptidase N
MKSDLLDDMRGFYRSTYTENGIQYWMAATDFEPVSARKAFICFDEPAMKANFTITMIIDPKYEALSNMPAIQTTTNNEGKKVVQFETSVKMSTYLVCFIVCQFEYVESTQLPTVRTRVWATPGTVNQTYYALQATVNILDYYQEYFGIPFPLPKLDMIAIPGKITRCIGNIWTTL